MIGRGDLPAEWVRNRQVSMLTSDLDQLLAHDRRPTQRSDQRVAFHDAPGAAIKVLGAKDKAGAAAAQCVLILPSDSRPVIQAAARFSFHELPAVLSLPAGPARICYRAKAVVSRLEKSAPLLLEPRLPCLGCAPTLPGPGLCDRESDRAGRAEPLACTPGRRAGCCRHTARMGFRLRHAHFIRVAYEMAWLLSCPRAW